MPASTRLFALLLALAAPTAGALAYPLYAVTVPGDGDVADLDSLVGVDPAGGWHIQDASNQVAATACRAAGDCSAVRFEPPAQVPEPGAVALLCFGLALVVLRGQRPADIRFQTL